MPCPEVRAELQDHAYNLCGNEETPFSRPALKLFSKGFVEIDEPPTAAYHLRIERNEFSEVV
jgi:hypothetical protein